MSVKVTALPSATTPLDAADTLMVVQGGVSKQAPVSGLPIASGQIDGLTLVWVSATALTVKSGSAYIVSKAGLSLVNSDIAKTGLSLSADTWYHVYLFETAGVPDIEIVTTAPSVAYNGTARSKTADNSRRYLGSVRAGSGGSMIKFEHTADNTVSYLNDVIGNLVASGVTATTETTVSAAAFVPVTGRSAGILMFNAATAGFVYISNSNGPTVPTGYLAATSPGAYLALNARLNSAQAFTIAYNTAPTGGAAHARIFGYSFER